MSNSTYHTLDEAMMDVPAYMQYYDSVRLHSTLELPNHDGK